MCKRVLPWLLALGGAFLPGCGSVQEVFVDAVRSAAKESLEQAIDDAVDNVLDEWLNSDLLFDGEGPLND